MSYSSIFLIRRSLFIAITFALLDKPGIQLQLMIWLSLLYISILSYVRFHDTKRGHAIEIFNECMFVCIQYIFVLLNQLVTDINMREHLGDTMVFLTSLLLILNGLNIIFCSTKRRRPKCRRCCIKRTVKRTMSLRDQKKIK